MRVATRIAAAFGVLVSAAALSPSAAAADIAITIWAPTEQAAVIREQLVEGFRGHPVNVVDMKAEDIPGALGSVDAAGAPDVIWADATSTARLVSDHVVKDLPISAGLSAQFANGIRTAFRYGFDDYGLPVTVSNVALVVNLKLAATPPATFGQLVRRARLLMDDGQATVGLAVGQGGPGDEHLLGPLFTGLGGYLFGKDPAGGLDPYNLGLATAALLANADRIDAWNKAGLFSADLSPAQAQRAFSAGRAPFWITGPSSRPIIDSLPFDVAVTSVPPIVKGLAATPFLSVEGVMVTVYADRHGVGDLAAGLVRRHFGSPRVQAQLARATLTAPAIAGATVSSPVRDFASAGQGGRPLPNIPQAAAVLLSFRQAWSQATGGDAAIPARTAFANAQRAALRAIG